MCISRYLVELMKYTKWCRRQVNILQMKQQMLRYQQRFIFKMQIYVSIDKRKYTNKDRLVHSSINLKHFHSISLFKSIS